MERLDPKVCYRALRTHDERFDGRLFVGVITTGIYCRPVCPAPPAKPQNCRFFVSASAAQEAGFRPCLRCRPETAPETGSWRGTSNTVSRGLALIAAGELDGDEASVDTLAERLGVGGRQLWRLFKEHLGASPVAVAQTRRVLFAKQLIHDTQLPMTEVAAAAGFGSIRRFNETFRRLYSRPPSALRGRAPGSTDSAVTLRLRYRPPYDWPAMIAYLRARAIDGVERVEDDRYSRKVLHGGKTGSVEISHRPDDHCLVARIRFPDVRALSTIVGRIRRVFDLGADVVAIGEHLTRDPLLKPLVKARPGLRVPGGWDGFEQGVRAILGQQITVEGGRKLAGKLVSLCGVPAGHGTFAFPNAACVLSADLSTIGMPNARRQSLVALAQASVEDPHLFEPLDTVEETVAKLRTLRGAGEWTAQYIALRAAREPDAFPASDLGLLRSAARCAGRTLTARELLERAERWRPWRGYAAQHLWTT